MARAPSRPHAGPEYLTTARVANVLGTNRRTLHNWIKAGKIPSPEVNPANGYYRWTWMDIDAVRIVLREAKEE
jgi:predicted site-specific integrase-resolvase